VTERQKLQLRKVLVDRLTYLYRTVHQDVRDIQVRAMFQQEEPPRDEGDESLRDQLQDLRLSLAEADSRLAQAIEGALGRMADGQYGECIDCGNPIELERLRAVPWAPRCVDCQEAVENEARQRPPSI
jgi:DnaK suppressor protein